MASSLPNSTSPNWNVPPTPPKEDVEEEDNIISAAHHHRHLHFSGGATGKTTPPSGMFPLRSFSSLGGGDAPGVVLPNMPRVRSQLFTISTRAVMTSTSQMSFTAAASSGAAGGIIGGGDRSLQHFSSSSSSVSVDSDIEEVSKYCEVKPLNTDVYCGGACRSPSPPSPSKITYKSKPEDWEELLHRERSSILSRSKRCIHGSFEDLLNHQRSDDAKRILNGNRRRSAPAAVPSTSRRGQMIQAANDLLVEENKYLVQTIQQLKRKLIMSKIATTFTLEAVKRRGKVIKAVEERVRDKERQCAARLILHSLLLNSWRNTKRELDMRLRDNADLRKSVENFALQVQVLRHVQTGERQKAQEKAAIIKNLDEELKIIKDENQTMRREMDKMESELNSLQASSQNLIDENQVLSAEIGKLIDTKEKLLQTLDWERLRAEQFSNENVAMKDKLKNLEVELKDATDQKSHWQERARCSESETWELQLHLESKTSSVEELTAACESLRVEKMKLVEFKSQLKSNLDRTTAALQSLTEKNDELMESFENVRAERDSKAERIQEMEATLESTKKEFYEIEKELLSYKLHNVRRRREWGNALYFIVSPMDAMRRKML